MTELVATTPGLFPLPDWAKEELADRKGRQKDDLISGDEGAEIEGEYETVREEFVDEQVDAGLNRIVGGQARWDDMLTHPLAVHDNVETGGIVRYYDNNNFYRDPTVVGELSFSGAVSEELAATAELLGDDAEQSLQAVLPGPYSLSDLASDDYYDDEAQFTAAIAEFLAGEAEAFPEHETLFLLEPSLTENAPGDGRDQRASEAIDEVADATDAEVVVQTYWGAPEEKVYAHLMDAGVDAFGLDFVTGEREQQLYNINEYGTKDQLALGLVDGQNTLVETPETIRERVDWTIDQIQSADFEQVYVTTNTELFHLPVNKYQEKLAALGGAVSPAEVEP